MAYMSYHRLWDIPYAYQPDMYSVWCFPLSHYSCQAHRPFSFYWCCPPSTPFACDQTCVLQTRHTEQIALSLPQRPCFLSRRPVVENTLTHHIFPDVCFSYVFPLHRVMQTAATCTVLFRTPATGRHRSWTRRVLMHVAPRGVTPESLSRSCRSCR